MHIWWMSTVGFAKLFNHSIGVTQRLGTFLCAFGRMCKCGAVRDPNWRYYSKKPMASWMVIFSHNVSMTLCVKSQNLDQDTPTSAAL